MSLNRIAGYSGGIIDQQHLTVRQVPNLLHEDVLGDVARLMAGTATPLQPYSALDFSLAGQLAHLGIGKMVAVPEAVAFTLYSAVPVADTIRGVYEAAGIEAPLLLGVECNGVERLWHMNNPATREAEVKRLSRVLDGRHAVTIIDEYVMNGSSVLHAHDLLSEAGATDISTIAGRWYEDAGHVDVNGKDLSSPLAAQMRAIGYTCFERYAALAGA